MAPGKAVRPLLLVLSALLFAGPAAAWVERRVQSSSAVVALERSGKAVVSHELLLVTRGSPLREFEVEPVDAGAELLPEATATLAVSGQAAGLPVPLTVTREGARLTFRVQLEKGLRSGTYQIRFSYRMDLVVSGGLVPDGADTGIEWRGPTFGEGIDSARVVFRIPRAARAPRLRTAEGEPESTDIAADEQGVFLGTVRRAGEGDEIEVVRPHVAKGERVVWRVIADSAAFDLTPARADVPASVEPAAPKQVSVARPLFSPAPVGGAALAALLYGLLVLVKSRFVTALLAPHRALSRPLLPLPAWTRAAMAAFGVLCAAGVILGSLPPVLAAVALLGSLAAATHLPPLQQTPLRGPGRWVRLDPDVLSDDGPLGPPQSARFVDAGHPLGFVLFASGLMGFIAGAVTLFPRSPYQACALALSSSVLFPIFCTGRAAEVVMNPAQAPRALLEWILRELRKKGIEAHPIGRQPEAGGGHDELRLLVQPAPAVSGLVGIEVGVDVRTGALGPLLQPFVIVRVADGETTADLLPRGLFWSRGRSADERVAVLRPRLPTWRVTRDLVRDLVQRLTEKPESRRPSGPARPAQSARSAPRSAGAGDSTRNPGTTSSPAHAT